MTPEERAREWRKGEYPECDCHFGCDGNEHYRLGTKDAEIAYLAGRAAGWRERGEVDAKEYSGVVAKSVVAVLIPEDTKLAERFLRDFNERRAAIRSADEEGE